MFIKIPIYDKILYMKDKIESICKSIKALSCPNCGSKVFNNSTCSYCGSKIEELDSLINELTSLITPFQFDKDSLLSLYTLKSFNIESVSQIIKDYGLDFEYERVYNTIMEKIKNNIELSEEDYKMLVYFIDNNLFIGSNKNPLLNKIMVDLILKKYIPKEEETLTFFKNFTEMFMLGYVHNPKVKYTGLSEEVIANSAYDLINIDINKMKVNLQNKNYIEILETIFHECTHTVQESYLYHSKKVNYTLLLMAMEEVIMSSFPNYYKENYENTIAEVDARYSASLCVLQFLESNNLKVNSNYFSDSLNREMPKYKNENRTLDGKLTDIYTLFDSVSHPDNLINRYPILSILYKPIDGYLVKKTKKEVEEDYETFRKNGNTFEISDEELDYLYNKIIEKYSNQLKV